MIGDISELQAQAAPSSDTGPTNNDTQGGLHVWSLYHLTPSPLREQFSVQSRFVITLSSGGIFWDRLISEALWDPVDLFDIIIPRRSKGQAKLPRLEVELV